MPTEAERQTAEFYARLWHERGFAVAWTAGREGDQAKQVTRRGWNKTEPIGRNAHGEVAAMLKRANPVVVAGQSGLVAIDCDSEEDVRRFQGFGSPPTMSWTTRQGRHFVYRRPQGAEFAGIYFEAGGITPKRECYLVMPPAIHPSGKAYTLDQPLREVAELPLPVYQAMLAAAGVQREETRERVAHGGKVPKGGRHAHLTSLVGRMLRDGVPEEAALIALLATNRDVCDPPHTEQHVRQLVRSAYKTYEPELPAPATTPGPKPRVRSLKDVDPHLTRWFPGVEFEGIVPRFGHLCALVGQGGAGKGHWLVMLAASLVGDVTGPMLYLGEEDADEQLKMRMIAAGCPDENFLILDRITFPSGLDDFEAAIKETGAKIAVIDSGAGHLDRDIKNNAVEDVRKVLDRLAAMSNRLKVTIVVLVHVGKNTEMAARSRGLGSSAWTDAVRHQLTMAVDADDGSRVIEVTKSNIGPTGTRRRLIHEDVPLRAVDPETGEWQETTYIKIVDDGPSVKTVESLLAHRPDGKEAIAYDELAAGLKSRIGGWHANEAKKEIADLHDLNQKTVWRAFKRLEKEGLAVSEQHGSNRDEIVWRWVGEREGGWDD